ncbi:MAG TPA: LytR C-terminal domain-containing protein [Gaiellaceae bacterium]|nr:LytR C-terminal domain-containing protein [Gaiellaceae bacterium]
MEAHAASSPLVTARLRRRLTLEEAAELTSLEVDDIKSLEESRTYRFPTTTDAIAAAVVYASALGITESEARELAGLPVQSVVERWSLRRWAIVLGFVAVVAAFMVFVLRPQVFPAGTPPAAPAPSPKPAAAAAPLPERWEIQVDVYNGTRRGNAAAGLANEIAGLAYGIGEVRNADRRNYSETRVYYPPGGEAVAQRLADELGVGITALPGGEDPNRLVVIVGARGGTDG